MNARELHSKLGSGQEFSNWIKGRIEKFGFTDGEDFMINLSESIGGRPKQEYHISIDMAKELSMTEKNARPSESIS